MKLAAKILIFLTVALILALALSYLRAAQREAAAEAAFPPDGQFVDVAGQQVHVVVRGSGPDIVLIHGASGSTRDLTFAFADLLSDRYRVFIVDRPGFGWSDALPGRDGGRIRAQAELLDAAVTQLGAQKPVVMGHSYGGAVALAWAVYLPETLSGLVVSAGASQVWEGGIDPFYKVTSSWLGGITVVPAITAFAGEERVNTAVDEIFEPQAAPEGYADYVGAGLSLRRKTLRVNARQRAALKPQIAQMVPLYPQITLPVEIIHGTSDLIVPASIHAEPLSGQIPQAALTLLPGIGHMPQHAAPEALVDAIDRAASRAGLR